jgi:hypothetical protein
VGHFNNNFKVADDIRLLGAVPEEEEEREVPIDKHMAKAMEERLLKGIEQEMLRDKQAIIRSFMKDNTGALHGYTFRKFTRTISGLSGPFAGDESQSVAGLYPEMCHTGRFIALPPLLPHVPSLLIAAAADALGRCAVCRGRDLSGTKKSVYLPAELVTGACYDMRFCELWYDGIVLVCRQLHGRSDRHGPHGHWHGKRHAAGRPWSRELRHANADDAAAEHDGAAADAHVNEHAIRWHDEWPLDDGQPFADAGHGLPPKRLDDGQQHVTQHDGPAAWHVPGHDAAGHDAARHAAGHDEPVADAGHGAADAGYGVADEPFADEPVADAGHGVADARHGLADDTKRAEWISHAEPFWYGQRPVQPWHVRLSR